MDHQAPIRLRLQATVECETDAQRGNLLGIQPFMVPLDYASERSFFAKIDGYFDVALRRGWLGQKTIVVLPEHLGTWLVSLDQSQRVYQAGRVADVMRMLVLGQPLSFFRALLSTRARDMVVAGLFRMKAALIARVYQRVFSRLAAKYAVTVVAGSVVLPSPTVCDGELAIGEGELYNISVVYGPDGVAHSSVVRKAFPTEAELPFVARASVAELPGFDTPAGRLGVLICADSWYLAAYEALKAAGVDLVAVPAYLAPDGVWERSWRGYDGAPSEWRLCGDDGAPSEWRLCRGDGAPAPDDVDRGDVNTITEGQAWLRYALAGRMGRAGIGHGITVFLRGALWDLGSDGHTIVVRGSAVVEAPHTSGAVLVNSWL